MKLNRVYLLIELLLLFFYFFIILFSITIQPINIILGFVFVFILPGYNLLSILKPRYKFIEKIGYAIVISIALESTFMLGSYILFYNLVSYPESSTTGFIFNPIILISAVLSINLILIFIKKIKNYKGKPNNHSKKINFISFLGSINRHLKLKDMIIIISFVLSLIFLCVSTIFSKVPNNDYLVNYVDYRSDFTFFSRVPIIFYFFLIISILSLAYIIFSLRNSYFILSMISLFLYCLWILPYLQIDNYFNHDSYFLLNLYEIYLNEGILSFHGYQITISNFDTLRYSTSLFSAILLSSATSMHINFVLWYLYPLFYIFLPFFFYSVLKKYVKVKKKNELILILLVIFILFTPQFLKYGHAPGTGVLGIIIYLILVVEFFNLMQKNKFNISNSFLIILLYFLLSLTHTEECLYFLFLIISYSIYHFFFEIKKIKIHNSTNLLISNKKLKKESSILTEIIDRTIQENKLKIKLIKILFLLIILTLTFYITLEFFGYFEIYFQSALGNIRFFDFFYDLIVDNQITVPFFLRGTETISTFMISFIIIGYLLLFIIFYLLFFKGYRYLFFLYNLILKIFKKIYHTVKKLILNKIFQFLFFPLIITLIIWLNLSVLGNTEENLGLKIIALILSYLILIIQLFFFMKGVIFYQIENVKQNFYLLTIIASSIIMVILLISDIWLVIYILHTRFLVVFVFCTSIMFQETYFSQHLMKKRMIYLKFLTILVLSLGLFYSLRTLAYG